MTEEEKLHQLSHDLDAAKVYLSLATQSLVARNLTRATMDMANAKNVLGMSLQLVDASDKPLLIDHFGRG